MVHMHRNKKNFEDVSKFYSIKKKSITGMLNALGLINPKLDIIL